MPLTLSELHRRLGELLARIPELADLTPAVVPNGVDGWPIVAVDLEGFHVPEAVAAVTELEAELAERQAALFAATERIEDTLEEHTDRWLGVGAALRNPAAPARVELSALDDGRGFTVEVVDPDGNRATGFVDTGTVQRELPATIVRLALSLEAARLEDRERRLLRDPDDDR